VSVRSQNNRVAKLLAARRLDEAERILGEIERALAGRPPAAVDPDDLDPAYDEYFYRCHRAHAGWARQAYAAALPHAERADELERAIYAAAKARDVREPADFAFVGGAWGLVSNLTGCRRFDDAERVFARIVGDDDFFWARRRRDAAAAERLLIACLCIYWERGGDAAFASGRAHVRRAQRLASPDGAELAYAYASFWARAGDPKRAFEAIETAIRRGHDPAKILDDDDMRSLHGDRRWEPAVVDRARRWKIGSAPPGARIWIDGVDTGQATPAKLRPPKVGMHRIRLALADHEDWTTEVAQSSPDMGLSLEAALVSHAERAEEARMADDGARPPGDAARARTRAFLGDVRRASAVVARGTTYGLGGVAVAVAGTGHAEIRKESWGNAPGHRETVQLDPAATAAVFEAFVEHAFTEMVIAPRPGAADELHFTITLTGAGGTHKLGKFIGAPHDRFMRLYEAVVGIVTRHLDRETAERLTL
jgi:tetratricopeptide (TPR) repeat protein